MKLSDARIDPVKVEEGEWIGAKYGTPIPEMGDLCVKVRGLNNVAWRRLQRELINAVPRKDRPGGRLSPKAEDDVTSRCLLAACLDDWSELEGDGEIGEADKPVPYDRKLAGTLLTDARYRPFRDAVFWAASQVGEQRAASQEDIAKN